MKIAYYAWDQETTTFSYLGEGEGEVKFPKENCIAAIYNNGEYAMQTNFTDWTKDQAEDFIILCSIVRDWVRASKALEENA